MDSVAIYSRLVDMGRPMSEKNIISLDGAIQEAIESGELRVKDGNYHASDFVYNVLKKRDTTWWRYRCENPKIAIYLARENFSNLKTHKKDYKHKGSLCLVYQGLFFVASIAGYDVDRVEKEKIPQIYVLRDDAHRALKVGYSIRSDRRIYDLKSANPFLQTVAIFRADNMKTEARLHKAIEDYRIPFPDNFEWYRDTFEVRDRINNFMLTNGFIDKLNPALAANPYPDFDLKLF